MHELKLMDVQKKYKDKEAVRKFNYTFTNGVYGLLGENGAGKTTLMTMYANSEDFQVLAITTMVSSFVAE